jgi:glycosyltransferase involved in cell wall biosynthesis
MKGVHIAIKALSQAQIALRKLNLQLDLIGDGEFGYLNELKSLAASLNVHVNFLGQIPRENIPAVLSGIDLLVLPSFLDTFPRVLLEGMVAKVPVIASATGGALEIIQDGVNGLLFPVGNSELLAQKIILMVKDIHLRRHLAEAGHHIVLEQFTLEKRLNKMEAYLSSQVKKCQ